MKRIICTAATVIMACLPIITSSDNLTGLLAVTAEASAVKTSAPAGLNADISGTAVKLTWNKVSDADGYRVYIYDNKDKKYKKYRDVSDNSLVIDNLKGGKTYFFKVASVRNGTVGEKSAKVKVFVQVSPAKWVKAYKRIIDNYINEPKQTALDCMCSLYDITGDGIPELLISGSDVHASGVEIYSYSNNKVIKFARRSKFDNELYYSFGSWGVVQYCPENGLLVDSYTGQGVMITTYYSFENGNMKEVIRLEDGSLVTEMPNYSEDEIYYKINDKLVTKKEYEKAYEKYSGETISLGRTIGIKGLTYDEQEMYIDEVWDKILNENWTGYTDMIG